LALFGFLSFAVYFKCFPLEWGFGVHWMTSDGFDEEIEWLFQLKEMKELKQCSNGSQSNEK
jgi:hypothetical protein